jgi:glycosyltransferase involved in cell wall biosynthesis
MDLSRPCLSVVLPVYNEERNVAAMAARLAEIAGPFGSYEILFVDDCSTDRSLSEIKGLAIRDRRIRFVAFTRNFGHQAALRAGLRYARGDAVILMDCDFEHPPELIPAMIAEWRKGAKIVVTERTSAPRQVSFLKSLSSRLFYRLLDAIGDVRIEPGSADFLLLDRAVVDTINGFEMREIFLRGLVRWLGYPLAKLTFTQGTRQEGESKFTLRRMIDFAVMGIIAHSIKPLRIAIHLSLVFAAIGVLLLVYSIASFLWVGHTVAGWTSVMSAIALLGAGQFLVLGIIGEYIGRLLGETRKWPVYLVAETEEPNRPVNASPARGAARAAGA